MLASLDTLEPNCPIQVCCKFVTQIETTLNILRTSWLDNSKSVYKDFHNRKFDWNRMPLTPLVTKVLMFKDPDNQTGWQPNETGTWCKVPEKEHYQLLQFLIQEWEELYRQVHSGYSQHTAKHQSSPRVIILWQLQQAFCKCSRVRSQKHQQNTDNIFKSWSNSQCYYKNPSIEIIRRNQQYHWHWQTSPTQPI